MGALHLRRRNDFGELANELGAENDKLTDERDMLREEVDNLTATFRLVDINYRRLKEKLEAQQLETRYFKAQCNRARGQLGLKPLKRKE